MTHRRTIAAQELYRANGRPPAAGQAGLPSPASADAPRLQCHRACDLAPRPVDWLWRNYIPRGAITLIDGDPGTGKSQFAIDLAARVSRGWAMPPEGGTVQAAPAGVLLLNAEDDPARVIRPRLDAAGADLDRVTIIDGVNEQFDRPVSLPEDLGLIRAAARKTDARLIVIDPLMAFLTGAVDAHKDADVRRVLHELKRFAEEAGAAVVVVRHLNKMVSVSAALYRGGGSIGIVGAARSALAVGRRPDDPKVRVLAGVKSNLGPLPPALAFAVEPVGDTSRVGWIGEVDLTADQVIQHGRPGRPPANLSKAVDFVREQLAGGPKPAAEVEEAASSRGISERTLKRAKKALQVVTGKPLGVWTWSRPDRPDDQGGQNPSDTRILAPLTDDPEKSLEIGPEDQGGQNPCGNEFGPPCPDSGSNAPAAAAYTARDLDATDRAILASLDDFDAVGPYRERQ
jgi:hypothetical protein